jgi:5'-nucleotidase
MLVLLAIGGALKGKPAVGPMIGAPRARAGRARDQPPGRGGPLQSVAFTRSTMKILLCNDDGYQAPGIVALHAALAAWPSRGDRPEQNNSAKSNALTLHAAVRAPRAQRLSLRQRHAGRLRAHRADRAAGLSPDLVVSGINNGANMGDDTIYSGTVGAAMEGYLFGIPAIAFSQVDKGWAHIDAPAQAAATWWSGASARRRRGRPGCSTSTFPTGRWPS